MSFDKLPDNVLILLIQDNLPQIEGKARDVEGTWKPAPPRGTKARRLNAQVSFSMVNKRVRLLASPSLFDVISFKSQSTLDHDVADLEFVIKSSSMMLQCVKAFEFQPSFYHDIPGADFNVALAGVLRGMTSLEDLTFKLESQDVTGFANYIKQKKLTLPTVKSLETGLTGHFMVKCCPNVYWVTYLPGVRMDALQTLDLVRQAIDAASQAPKLENFDMYSSSFWRRDVLNYVLERMPNLIHLGMTGETKCSSQDLLPLIARFPCLDKLVLSAPKHASPELCEDFAHALFKSSASMEWLQVGTYNYIQAPKDAKGKRQPFRWHSTGQEGIGFDDDGVVAEANKKLARRKLAKI